MIRHTGFCINFFRAFTLAEVLITLGIIGVVAAMTMPAVISNYKKQETLTRLKKSYTTLNQALKISEAENGEYEYWESGISMGANEYIQKYWLPYFNVIKICNSYSECGYNSNNPYKFLNGSQNGLSVASINFRIPFITSDGITYFIGVAAGTIGTESSTIWVDINGSKGPNRNGIDLFTFERVKGKGILPYCYNLNTDNINSDCSKDGKGDCCSQRIIMNGWQFEKDYPFK